MNILYVAKHDSGGNDDEGAIHFALEALGHRVERLREIRGFHAHKLQADFCLFHHWKDYESIRAVRIPRVFWGFDLIEWPGDPTLAARNQQRLAWMNDLLPLIHLGFMSDGDFVAKHPDKLVWLTQGFDERQKPAAEVVQDLDVVFFGIGKGGGQQRESFIKLLSKRYGHRFTHFPRGVYQESLARVIARSKIVVAPDSPVTDRYWSNRIYNMLGFQAFLMHPRSAGVEREFSDADLEAPVEFYRDRENLLRAIDHFLLREKTRRMIAQAGRERILQKHLYRHRCETMVHEVKRRLGI